MITSFLASQHAFCFQQILAEKESTTNNNSVVGGGNLKNNILGGNLKNNNNSLHRHHQGPLGNIVHHNFDHGEHDDDALMPKVRILFIHIIEGPIKEFRDFEATLFVDIENAQTNISRKKIFVQRFPKFYVYLCFKNVASKSQTYSIFPSNLHCSVR